MLTWLTLSGAVLLVAYVLGSIPTGYTAARVLKGIDIREYGSGSTGATNVLRTLGTVPGAFVLLVDALKGYGAIAFTHWLVNFAANNQLIPPEINAASWLPWMVASAGLAVILGHSKSIWLGFSGGKSVATSLGVLFAMSWMVGLSTMGVFGLVVAFSRIVSLSSIASATSVPLLTIFFHQPLAYVLFALTGSFYVIWRHRSNIERLIAGTEPQIGQNLATQPEQILK